MSEGTKIERVPREVINDKLLTGMLDEDKVAMLATHEELNLFILAFDFFYIKNGDERFRHYAEDLRLLRSRAFP